MIVGLSSCGQATYEKEYNGGMGSNGLTSARHDVFSKYLAEKYPESYDHAVPQELVYSGGYKLTDAVEGAPVCAGKLVLSPTRTYAPVVKRLLDELRPEIHGSLYWWSTDKGSPFCFGQLPCHQGQYVPSTSSVQDHSGAEWHRLVRNVQGFQYGSPAGSLSGS